MIFEEDDLPPGFAGESQWADIEAALSLVAPENGRGTVVMGISSAGATRWTGFTHRADDGLSTVQRYVAKLKQDPVRLQHRKKRLRVYAASRYIKVKADPEKLAKHRAYMREYMREYMRNYKKKATTTR